ncbi:hypothetical protein [Tenacibaculum jejuense]|uniref:hypothetical protein n=1 Tax=Tenacibaculum jejuense TaxID=584609 RepID=UPI000BA4CA02|nr:hypothetical protein [Tenacibaculum jejuense]
MKSIFNLKNVKVLEKEQQVLVTGGGEPTMNRKCKQFDPYKKYRPTHEDLELCETVVTLG